MDDIWSPQTLGHLAYTLIFFSFLVKRLFYLRIFMIVASIASIAYNYHIADMPLWTPIQWNILFILTNLYHVGKVLMESRRVQFNQTEQYLYATVMSQMDKVDFKRLMSLGFTRTYHRGEELICENEELDCLYLIANGSVDILKGDDRVAKLGAGKYVGEMSFLTGATTKASVKVCEQSTIHTWPKMALKNFLNQNPNTLLQFHASIGNQLIDLIINDSIKDTEPAEIKIAA